jgi:hypothetical protein
MFASILKNNNPMAQQTKKDSPTILIAPKTYREHTTEIEYDDQLYAMQDKDKDKDKEADDKNLVYYDIKNYTVENNFNKPKLNSIYDFSNNIQDNTDNVTYSAPISLESLSQSK